MALGKIADPNGLEKSFGPSHADNEMRSNAGFEIAESVLILILWKRLSFSSSWINARPLKTAPGPLNLDEQFVMHGRLVETNGTGHGRAMRGCSQEPQTVQRPASNRWRLTDTSIWRAACQGSVRCPNAFQMALLPPLLNVGYTDKELYLII